ncbi:ribosome maturation factor RimM [Chelativorans sp.]|uniref:ribosome maturation factor RimM n=1 Tax=Chelativorans sp. TaxID=2203393 RepID=UPI002811D293|nr:ribosome maturation factor RimM [Chelativorans sp.]
MARSNNPTRLENPVQLGVIGAAHGLKGEVRVKAFTDDPLALGGYGPLHTADGRALTVAHIRPAKDLVIIRFEGVNDRSAAEALNGVALFVDRSALPRELEEEEFYHADLVGLAAFDETGESLGRVVAVHNFGAGDILEIRPSSGITRMIPFTRDAVPEIDLAEGILRIDSLAAGLDNQEAEAEEQSRSRHGFDRGARPRGPKSAGGNR